MTHTQKQQILAMRNNGKTYAEIAELMDLPKNTVKTFCWRNRTNSGVTVIVPTNQCIHCGTPIDQRPKQKPRRFCDDTCRFAWWKDNRDKLNKKALYPIVCAHCGKRFDSYGNKGRKYCRHDCYIADRFKSESVI